MKYLNIGEVMARYSVSRATARTMFREIEGCGRYPEGAVIRTPGQTLVLETVMHDYIRNRVAISNGIKLAAYSAGKIRAELKALES